MISAAAVAEDDGRGERWRKLHVLEIVLETATGERRSKDERKKFFTWDSPFT